MRALAQAVIAILAVAGIRSSAPAATAAPDPNEILRVARIASTQQEAGVRGHLRNGNERLPFVLKVNYGVLRFEFPGERRVIDVRLDPESSTVLDAAGKPLRRGLQDPVGPGADVTVEDLSLGFLYWPDARLLGEETVRTRSAWKIELRPGRQKSAYAVVRVWVDQESGALLRIDGFDGQGRLSRRFEVVSGQRIDGRWMLKQMRIERYAPETSARPEARSYLEITGRLD